MEITLATHEDVDGILPLQTQIYRVDSLPETAKQTLEELIDADFCDIYVAKEDGKVIGSGLIYYLKNPGHETPFAFLEGVVVDESYRGKGIGSELTKHAIDLAKKRGCYKILLTSKIGKEDVHAFYEKLGFVKWGFEFRMDLD